MDTSTQVVGATEDESSGPAFARLGSITRELHQALHALGAMPELQRVVQEIPDARERLGYVGEMTANAAHRVLNLVDTARPDCNAQAAAAREMAEALARTQAMAVLGADEARRMLALCGAHAAASIDFAESQSRVLSDIMLAQDFQDLSGQVIKKVIDMIGRTERQLVQMLLEDPAATTAASAESAALQGPQTPDKALAQDDVDDLLASMGF